MAQLPKGGLVRGHDKPIHGSCAIYFPGGTGFYKSQVVIAGFLPSTGMSGFKYQQKKKKVLGVR